MFKRFFFVFIVLVLVSSPAAAWLDGCEECYFIGVPDPEGSGSFEGSVCLDLGDGGWTICHEFTSGGGPAGCFVFYFCPLW